MGRRDCKARATPPDYDRNSGGARTYGSRRGPAILLLLGPARPTCLIPCSAAQNWTAGRVGCLSAPVLRGLARGTLHESAVGWTNSQTGRGSSVLPTPSATS